MSQCGSSLTESEVREKNADSSRTRFMLHHGLQQLIARAYAQETDLMRFEETGGSASEWGTLIVGGRLGSIHLVQLLQRLLLGQLGVGVPLAQWRLAGAHLVRTRASLLLELSQFPLLVLLGPPKSHRHRILRAHVRLKPRAPLSFPLRCEHITHHIWVIQFLVTMAASIAKSVM